MSQETVCVCVSVCVCVCVETSTGITVESSVLGRVCVLIASMRVFSLFVPPLPPLLFLEG